MRFLIAMVFAALASANSLGQDDPLDRLTVTSTRLKCLPGFAEITYGYRRGTPNAEQTELEFVVIQTDKYNSRFQTIFHLSSKVDDVTPPAYLAMEEHTVDLPNKNQLHAVSGGRYQQTDSDITLAEIRAWLDQPELLASVDSLLDYKVKMRASRHRNGG